MLSGERLVPLLDRGLQALFDLGRELQLTSWAGSDPITLVVLTGSRGPFAVPVDEVVGFFPSEAFSPLTVSPFLTRICRSFDPAFELWGEEVLVRGDAGAWEHMRD